MWAPKKSRWIRYRLQESPTFVHLEEQEQVAEHPLRNLMKNSPKKVLVGIGLRMAENGGSYLFQTLAVSFAVTAGISKSAGALAVAISAVVSIFTVPWTGHLSDRYGRVPVYRIGALLMMIYAFPAWYLLSLGNPVIVTVVITVTISLGVAVMLGPQCALLPELFGNRRRYIGVAVSREVSAVLAGGLAPVIGAGLLANTGDSWLPIAIYVLVLAAITFATTFATPETKGRDLTSLEEATRLDTPETPIIGVQA